MMKLLIGTSVAALGLAAPVLAQVPPPPGVDQGTAPAAISTRHSPPVILSPVRVRSMPEAMTREQVLSHVRAMFTRLDANHDGFVSKDEIAAFHGRMTAMGGMAGPRAERVRIIERHEGMMRDPAKMFDQLDTNHDGVISKKEFMAAHARMHEGHENMGSGMMADHQAMTSMGAPMAAMHEQHAGAFLGRFFDQADTNHDGRLSLQEAEAAALAHFDRMDVNHDGRVTPDERPKMPSMQSDQH